MYLCVFMYAHISHQFTWLNTTLSKDDGLEDTRGELSQNVLTQRLCQMNVLVVIIRINCRDDQSGKGKDTLDPVNLMCFYVRLHLFIV